MTTGSEEARKSSGGVHLHVQMSAGEMAPGSKMTAVEAQRIENLHVHGLQVSFAGLDWQPAPWPTGETLPDPGDLPPGSRLDLLRNAIFSGRVPDLLALAEGAGDSLHPPGGSASPAPLGVLAAAGMGGIGKTQLAVEFCYRYGRCFYGVHWLDARQDPRAEIAACGEKMALQPWPEKLPEQAALTERLWQAESAAGLRHLAVLDNVEDEAQLRLWLPHLRGLQVVFTSRQPDWSPDLGITVQRMDVLKRSDSRVLLLKLAPRLEAEPQDDINRLCESLGDLPLALHLAGSYLRDIPLLEVRDYLEELENNLLAHESQAAWSRYTATAHQANLVATFDLSWQRLAGDAFELERRLFMIAGWCAANTPIPGDLLGKAAQTDAAIMGQFNLAGFFRGLFGRKGQSSAIDSHPLTKPELARSLSRLVVLGLLEATTGGGVKIHPLVSEFARSMDSRSAALRNLVVTLNSECNNAQDSGFLIHFLPLRTHALAAAEWSKKIYPEYAAAMLRTLGFYLTDLMDLAAAKRAMEEALTIDEAKFGGWSQDVAVDLMALSSVLMFDYKFAEARSLLERSLAINERIHGLRHPEVANCLNQLCAVYARMGDMPAAHAAGERALAIDERKYGSVSTAVADDLSNLGDLLLETGDLNGAKKAYERVLAIREQVYGAKHPNLSASLYDLGQLLMQLEDYQGARTHYERALELDESLYGPVHPNVRRSVRQLARISQELGDLNKARELHERAYQMDQQIYGDEHPRVAEDLMSLGTLRRDVEDFEGGWEAYERALQILERVYGADHPEVADGLLDISRFHYWKGDMQSALEAAERALRIFTQAYGPDHAAVAWALGEKGSVLEELHDLPGARAAYEGAIKIFARIYGPDYLEVGRNLQSLGRVREAMGDLAEARDAYRQALVIYEKRHGSEHAVTAELLSDLGAVLRELNELTEAREACQRALAIAEKVYGAEHEHVAVANSNLASVLHWMGDLAGARAGYERALRILEQLDHPDEQYLKAVRENYARFVADTQEDNGQQP